MERPSGIAACVLLAAGTLLMFRAPLLAMVEQWDASPMYSYGYVVPVISAYLLWSRREQFARTHATPSRLWGAAVILGSLAALAIGRVSAIQVLEQLSFVSMIAGIVLFVFGGSYLLLAAPAIVYLLFMVPIWDAFTEPLHWPFQINSAKLGVSMMQAIGIPVHREGTIIALPNLLIEVARECSGVNYLIAVLALALPMAFLRLPQMWRRVVLIVSAVTVAALANSLRVALIGALAYYELGAPLHGPFHVLHGLFVAGIGFVVIFAGLRLLEQPHPEAPVAQHSSRPQAPLGWHVRDVVGLAVLFITLGLVGVAPEARAVELTRPLEELPRSLGRWTAPTISIVRPITASPAPPGVTSAWGSADQHLSRLYQTAAGRTASVEIFYFSMQRQDREILSSAAADLHRSASQVAINETSPSPFSANVVQWPDRKQTGLFWYHTGGRAEAGQVATKLSTIWRALRRGQTNGAAIVLRTTNDASALDDLRDLATALRPALGDLWSSDDSY